MGNKKEDMVHVQGWLNPNNEQDAKAIEARDYFKSKNSDWSDRQLISTALAKLMEHDKTGNISIEPQTSETQMLRHILVKLSKIMGMMAKMKSGYVITDQDQIDISDAQRQIADDTLNYMISAPTEFEIDDDEEWD